MCAPVTKRPWGHEGYFRIAFDECTVMMLHEERGFLNPKLLCKKGCKEVAAYNQLSHRDKLAEVLRRYDGEPYHRAAEYWDITGWYFHPAQLLDVARWVSSDAFAAAAIILDEVFSEDRSRLSNLLACGEPEPSYNPDEADPSKWRIQYSDELEFVVDRRGWFEATRFIEPPGRRSVGLHHRQIEVDIFRGYLRNKNLYNDDDQFYHPLLFLLLLQCDNDLDKYVRGVRVVFCSDGAIPDGRFRQACRELRPSIPSGRSREQLEREVAELRHQKERVRQELAIAWAALQRAQELMRPEGERDVEELGRGLEEAVRIE